LRRDDHLADLDRHQSVRCLAEHQCLEHLTRLEQRRFRRGPRDDIGKLGLDRRDHPPTLPDSG
jgi:hypothetical protein